MYVSHILYKIMYYLKTYEYFSPYFYTHLQELKLYDVYFMNIEDDYWLQIFYEYHL